MEVTLLNLEVELHTEKAAIQVAVDCIIFGFDGAVLKALLVRRAFEPAKGEWSLIGGFIHLDETPDDAATRVLQKLAGMTKIYMEQIHTFSAIHRDTAGRVISIAYFALVNINQYSEQLHSGHEAKWFPLDEIPSMIFDHQEMVAKAKEILRQKVSNQPIGFELLPEKFTLQQLQRLYEAIYGMPLDKRNFIKKVLSMGILHRLEEKADSPAKKKPFYYIFDAAKYNALRSSGIRFINSWG
jgi:ADP-ribose pyrophosphatase YjhB (NUDIX family)